LQSYNVTEKTLVDRIKVRLTLEALLKGKLDVSAKEIQDYYDANKSQVDPSNKGLDAVKSQVADAVKQQKLQTESQTLLTELQNKYKVSSELSNINLTFAQYIQSTIVQPVGNFFGSFNKKK
jgi:DNA topoisomerase IB